MLGCPSPALLHSLARDIQTASPDIHICVIISKTSVQKLVSLNQEENVIHEILHAPEGFLWGLYNHSGRLQRFVTTLIYKRGKKGLGAESGGQVSSSPEIFFPQKPLVSAFLDFLMSIDTASVYHKWKPLLADADVIQLHSVGVTPSLIAASRFAKTKPLITSLWGTHVLRSFNVSRLKRQRKLLLQSKLITHSTPEFRECALTKYGRDLFPKYRETYFSPNYLVLKIAAELDFASSRKKIGQYIDLREGDHLICIGHNGSPGNQHREIIDSLEDANLDPEKTHLVVPFAYAGTSMYEHELEGRLKKSGYRFTILKDFLSEEDLAVFRKATDILIFAPVSDSFAATVTQALAAGSHVISGGWLPYKKRRLDGFMFEEVRYIGEVGDVCKKALVNLDATRSNNRSNIALALKVFSPEELGGHWCAAYEEATQR